MIKIDFVHLHAPLFHSTGVNLGDKVHGKAGAGHKAPAEMYYFREFQELHVTYGGKTVIVPATNIVSMQEHVPDIAKTAPAEEVLKSAGAKDAQVDSPQSHVFAGPGKGQTGFGGKVK